MKKRATPKINYMQRSVLMLLILFNCSPSFAQTQISNPKLKSIIDSLYTIDQKVQQDAIEAFQRTGSIDTFMLYEKTEHRTFERHIPVLKKIYEENGYPTVEKVGKESSSKFFTLIQHADKDINFQIKMLPTIKKQVDEQLIPGSEYVIYMTGSRSIVIKNNCMAPNLNMIAMETRSQKNVKTMATSIKDDRS